MREARAYSKMQFVAAVLIASLLGWVSVAAPFVASYILRQGHVSPLVLSGASSLALAAALVGIPIALVACWAVAGPILWRVMERPVTWCRAALWGAVIATIMVVAAVAIARLNGLRSYFDPTFDFQIGGGDFVQEIDGILTPFGWLLTARDGLTFVLCGVAIALVIRGIVGPGQVRLGEKTAAE